jgi:hypothetical protein
VPVLVLKRTRQPDRFGEAASRVRRAARVGPRRLGRVVELGGSGGTSQSRPSPITP